MGRRIKVFLLLAAAALMWQAPGVIDSSPAAATVRLIVGRTKVIRLRRTIKRVSVGNPGVVHVRVLDRRQVLLVAKSIGSTNVTIWTPGNRVIGSLEVQVRADLTQLKARLYRILPGEKIQVHSARHSIVLTGTVTTPEAKIHAGAIAQAFLGSSPQAQKAPAAAGQKQPTAAAAAMDALKKMAAGGQQQQQGSRVVNLLRVSGLTQVLLKVRFAEVHRSITRRFTANLGFLDLRGAFVFTMLNNLLAPATVSLSPTGAMSLVDATLSSQTGIMGGYPVNNNTGRVLGFIDALKQNGMAKILAEPNLMTTSGVEAKFLAGGEFPVPVPGQDGTIRIEWKKYGVQLAFLPHVLADGRIRMKVSPEVAEPDSTTGVTIQSYVVPGVKTRRASTTVQLKSGQSFAIAGLFRNDIQETVGKVPLLGDIPILGLLFRSQSFIKRQTELVIVVTPYVVRPDDHKPGPLPTDYLVEPSEFEWYLFGSMVRKVDTPQPQPYRHDRRRFHRLFKGLDGPFGHDWSL
jgi:pilus assembly protein CpaC